MNESELKSAFEQRLPQLDALGKWVVQKIKTELSTRLGTTRTLSKFFQMEPKHRVKEVDSFLEKALVRKRKDNPLEEITDQVGLRIVVLLLEDIDLVGQTIAAIDWKFRKDRDHEEERLAKPDYFAYQSDHYVIWNKEQMNLGGVDVPANLPCEIQVRTILQHAYAEMAHGCDYKPSIRLPEEDKKRVKRSLAKGSALIETTDDVFREIVNRLHEYSKSSDALLKEASQLYESAIGQSAPPHTPLSLVVTDAYREQMRNLTPDALRQWFDEQAALKATILTKRQSSVFYRDAIVVLLGWLVDQHRTSIPRLWPVDSEYLEDFYSGMGLSTTGLF